MALVAPYLIVGFDVDAANPNAAKIIADVQASFPLVPVLPLGVENFWAVEVPPSQMNARFERVVKYLSQKDQQHADALRWVVQLCLSSDVAGG